MNNIEYAEKTVEQSLSTYIYTENEPRAGAQAGWFQIAIGFVYRTDCTPLIVCKSPGRQIGVSGRNETKNAIPQIQDLV